MAFLLIDVGAGPRGPECCGGSDDVSRSGKFRNLVRPFWIVAAPGILRGCTVDGLLGPLVVEVRCEDTFGAQSVHIDDPISLGLLKHNCLIWHASSATPSKLR